MLPDKIVPGGKVPTDKYDAAISLCSMALQKPARDQSSLPIGTGAAAELMQQQSQDSRSQPGNQLTRIVSSGDSDDSSSSPVPKESNDKCATNAQKKTRTRKREPRVTLDEMKRLMAVSAQCPAVILSPPQLASPHYLPGPQIYGPTKCFRHRPTKSGGGTMSALSIKRKFYRW